MAGLLGNAAVCPQTTTIFFEKYQNNNSLTSRNKNLGWKRVFYKLGDQLSVQTEEDVRKVLFFKRILGFWYILEFEGIHKEFS